MKILLDCRFKKGAGPNVTATYLLDHLIKLNTEHEFIILQHRAQSIPDYPGVKKIFVPVNNNWLEFAWVQLYLPFLFHKLGVDIYHSLKHLGPFFSDVPRIQYIREVGHFFPEGWKSLKFNLVNQIYDGPLRIFGLRRATHIIGLANETKTVLMEKFGFPESKITINNNGLDPKFKVIQDTAAIRACQQRYNLPERYILCVSNLYPHKNYDTVVKVLAKLRETTGESHKLVFVGEKSYAKPEFFQLIEDLQIGDDIIFTNFVKHEDLVYIYNGASMLLYPPIIGSFGNPPLEAMACGIPVIISQRGALPEVTGGAAYELPNPTDVDEMLAAVQRVLHDEQLRNELRQKGFQRIKHFSWEASAARIFEVYRKVGKEKYSEAIA